MKSFEELMHQEQDKLLNCVHCGLCLDECPTYRISGDENNSPRGRLALWRAVAEKRLPMDEDIKHYSDECVGCFACVSACPANVPYDEILIETRAEASRQGWGPPWSLRLGAALAARPKLFSLLAAPLRFLRGLGLSPDPRFFKGSASLWESTRTYAVKVREHFKPQGDHVAFLEGCLMEAAFREINFASLRVLALNGYQVEVPASQGCCGALQEHAGLPYDDLWAQNRKAFEPFRSVISNSSGCGLALSKSLEGKQRDLIDLLNSGELKLGAPLNYSHAYYDFPCHAYHGLGLKAAPEKIFRNLGLEWSLAPEAEQCCGSGGSYQFTHPENSKAILKEKAAFLDDSPYEAPLLVTANHVCMMQWSQAKTKKAFQVKHLIQLLDESYEKAGYYKGL